MLRNSEVVQKFQHSRNKTSVLTCFGNGKFFHDQLIARLTCTSDTLVYFSLLVGESNDKGVEAKDLVMLLRFINMSVMKAITCFIDLPTANNGNF